MFNVALKSLLGRKLRLLMSTFAIVLGVAFVAGSLVFSDTLGRSFTALFASTVGDVVVRPAGGTTVDGAPSTRTIPADLVDTLETADGAARVDGNINAFGVFVVDRENKVMGGQGAPGIGGSWNDAPAGHGIEGLSIVEGREPRGVDEVVLDSTTAERAGYGVGDRIHVVTASTQALLRPTLVGVADFADGGSLNGASLVLWDVPSAQQLFLGGKDAFTDIWVTADGVSQEDLRTEVAALLPDDVEAVTGDEAAEESASALLEAISFITIFLLIFAGISLVVGAFLIVNTFSILVAQRSRELALLRALGASKRQVTRSVLVEAFVLGVVGSTIGLGLGVLLAMGIRVLFGQFGLDLSGQPLIFEPRTVLAAYAVGVVVTMAAAYLPARHTARIAPVQALRDDVALPESSLHRRAVIGSAMMLLGGAAMTSGLFFDVPRAGWVVGLGILAVLLGVAAVSPIIGRPFLALARLVYARLFGTVGNLAGQNSLRNPRRTAATASALMIGLALACTMAIVGDSAKASVDRTIEENFVGDYVVSNLFGQGFSPTIADEMEKVEGVEAVVRQRFGLAEIDGDGQGIGGVDPGTVQQAVDLEMESGRLDDLRDGTVLVSDEYAADHDLGVGDQLKVDAPSGRETLDIGGVFVETPVLQFPILTTNQTLLDMGFADQDNYLIINADEGSAGVQQRLEAVVADLPIVTVKARRASPRSSAARSTSSC